MSTLSRHGVFFRYLRTFCGSSGAGHGVVHGVQANEVRPSVSGPRNARCGGAALEDFFCFGGDFDRLNHRGHCAMRKFFTNVFFGNRMVV